MRCPPSTHSLGMGDHRRTLNGTFPILGGIFYTLVQCLNLIHSLTVSACTDVVYPQRTPSWIVPLGFIFSYLWDGSALDVARAKASTLLALAPLPWMSTWIAIASVSYLLPPMPFSSQAGWMGPFPAGMDQLPILRQEHVACWEWSTPLAPPSLARSILQGTLPFNAFLSCPF